MSRSTIGDVLRRIFRRAQRDSAKAVWLRDDRPSCPNCNYPLLRVTPRWLCSNCRVPMGTIIASDTMVEA